MTVTNDRVPSNIDYNVINGADNVVNGLSNVISTGIPSVRDIVPLIEYTGDGVTTKFDWDWDMIEDSSINVLVDNLRVSNWALEGLSVVFNTAPEDGAFIQIYRRTIIHMPENYQAFGRFHSEKTELSVDRAILIAQELTSGGIVGSADLSTTRGEFDLTVHSELGTDAVLPMYAFDDVTAIPLPPDPSTDETIIWDGDPILAGLYSLPGNTEGISTIIAFSMNLIPAGDPAEASAIYPNYNALEAVGWLNTDPSDDEYWMRVTAAGDIPHESRYSIQSGDVFRALGDIFQLKAGLFDPFISVFTFGDTAPSTQIGTFNVEICKDNGSGIPDEGWVSRIVTLEARFNA